MKNRFIAGIGICIAAFIAFFVAKQVITVENAHATFANYYTFRGCTQLIQKTNTYALCKLSSGKTIKFVEYKGKWYLDNDLPWCVGTFCF